MTHYDKPSIETDRDGQLYGFSDCIDWSQFTDEEKRLTAFLPCGGGINHDWHLEKNSSGKIVCHNSYQVMSEYGYYIGWADFSVRFKAEALDKFRLMFHGNRAQYLARYYRLRQYLEPYFVECFDLAIANISS